MSFFSNLFGGGGISDEARNTRNLLKQTRGNFSDLINQLVSRGDAASSDGRLTAQDLFGEQITRLGDSARSVANSTKQALSRALMAGGGDPTGAAGANLLGIDEQLNRQIGQQGLQFEGMAQGENRFRTQRADNLLGMGMQGLQGLFGMDQSRLQDRLMMDQARKDRSANIFGNVLQAGSTVAAAALCWVAIELYGDDSNEYHSIRGLLLEHEKTEGELAEFVKEYRKYGEQWAEQIKSDPVRRLKAEALFDQLYEYAKAA